MRKPSAIAILVVCAGAPVFGAAIYGVGSNGTLYSLSVTGNRFGDTDIAAISGTSGTLTDIAELNGQLYVTNGRDLFSVNSTNGDATLVGAFGSGLTDIVALTFGPTGTLYAAAVGDSADYYTVNTSTGAATAHATTGTSPAIGIDAAGDLEVVGSTLYVVTGGDSGGDSGLAEINLTNGDFTNLGEIETSGGKHFTDVFGLAIANNGTSNELYGFTAGGDILEFSSISPANGTVRELTAPRVFPHLYGATDDVVTDQVTGAAEPGTLNLLGLGLLGVGGLARRGLLKL